MGLVLEATTVGGARLVHGARVPRCTLGNNNMHHERSSALNLPYPLVLLACRDAYRATGRMACRVRTAAPHGRFLIQLNLNETIAALEVLPASPVPV